MVSSRHIPQGVRRRLLYYRNKKHHRLAREYSNGHTHPSMSVGVALLARRKTATDEHEPSRANLYSGIGVEKSYIADGFDALQRKPCGGARDLNTCQLSVAILCPPLRSSSPHIKTRNAPAWSSCHRMPGTTSCASHQSSDTAVQ